VRVSGVGVKHSTITVSKNACAFSAAVIADAQAACDRARRSVHRAGNTRRRASKQRQSMASARSR
jgi:hypothetical protein